MKYMVLFIGFILFVYGAFQCSLYIRDYDILTNYGQGYVWGSIVMLLLGVVLLVWGFRKFRSESS